MITLILIAAVVSVLPIKWAADFTEGKNTGLFFCLLASVVAPAIAIFVFRMSPGGFTGFMVAFLALDLTYVAILRIPARTTLSFAVVVLALQGAMFMALLSLGVNVGKLLLGHQ